MNMISGDRGTGNILAVSRKIDMEKAIALLQPDAAPLTVILKMLKSKSSGSPKFQWLEDELCPSWDAINYSTGYTSVATNLAVDNGSYFKAGDVVKNATSAEVVLVISVSTNTLKVTRKYGETSGYTMSNDAKLVILGNCNEEGASAASIKSTQKADAYNYTQIFKKGLGLTGTEKASDLYGGKDLPYQRHKAGIEHLVDIEHAFLFGERKEDTGGTHPKRMTRGLLKWITTNVTNISDNTLSESNWNTFVESVFKYQGKAKNHKRLFLASSIYLSALDYWGRGKLNLVPKDKTYGIEIFQYLSSHGTLLIKKHDLLQEGYAGYGFAIDPDSLQYRYMSERDTKLKTNVQAPGDDKEEDEYLTECGLQFELEKRHGRIWNVTSYV